MDTCICTLLPLKAVTQKTSLSRATIYRRIKDGTFPKPVRIGARRIAWHSDHLAAWLDECLSV